MVNKIYNAKNQVLGLIESRISERGIDRVDIHEMGELADIVKDFAEAEKNCWKAQYYRAQVSNSMETRYGYSQGGTQSYNNNYNNVINEIRQSMMNSTPEERERMRNEIHTIIGSM